MRGSGTTTAIGGRREVCFALDDNSTATFPADGGSTTPRLPPPTMDASETARDHDRRSSRLLELEAAACAVFHPAASVLLQVLQSL